MKKIIAIIGILVLLVIGMFFLHPVGTVHQNTSAVHPTATAQKKQTATISYKGHNGVDALTLLKKQATVEQDHSGMVTGINGYKPVGHTYWAFYVNGKLASVGPAQYITKNSDTILWKVEKY